ncbi:GntR family transcriptional regulator [Rhodospirillaceae bacterium KN72]|uniref:GntR family transcriptional regulator n=2 Tax=Pacificispira spongiicola TaxID=2729598 RepID=A0A7Y0HIE5_9PROT|nr:GntR family transcriptional regulator [Pacificispira spongiicola]
MTKNNMMVADSPDDDRRARLVRHPVRRVSASQQIHDSLRDRIVSLELAPGQNLSRIEQAEFYGVSQTPVRDAMLKLEEEGLLVIYPQSKTEVSRIDLDHARETQFLRLSLELEVTRSLSKRRDPSMLKAAREALASQQAALRSGKLDLFSRFDKSFHRSLCEAAGVPDLWQLIQSRSGHIDRLRSLNLPDPGKPSSILAYHEKILSAIEDGDTPRLETAVREHLSGTLAMADKIAERHPEFF